MKIIIRLLISLFVLYAIGSISCNKELSCYDCKENKPPIANAGADQKIVLPIDSVLLDGSLSSDRDGSIKSFHWTKISGPLSSNIIKPDSSQTLVNALAMGVYKFELTVTDNGGLKAKDTVQIIVNDPAINQPPVANAGPDQTITLPTDSVLLNGSLSFDPDGTITSYKWSKISGPVSSNIIKSDSSKTLATALVIGVYKFELKVTDNGGLSAKDTVQIIVNNAAINQPPTANAGPDQTIILPTDSVGLNGTGTDPEGSIKSYNWSKVTGPAQYMIVTPNLATTKVRNLVKGTYQFELTVTDGGGLISKDTMSVNVIDNPCGTTTNRPLINAQLIPVSIPPDASKMIGPSEMVGAIGNKLFFLSSTCNNCYGTVLPVYNIVNMYDVGTNTWSSNPLSEARNEIAVTTLGNKIFFGGGTIYEDVITISISSAVDIYDASTNAWTLERLSRPKYRMSAAATGNKVLFAGGVTLGGTVNDVDILDVNTRAWSKAALSEARYSTSSVSLSGKVYFAGGVLERSPDYSSGRIDIYDNTTGGWSTSTLSEPASAMAAIASDSKIYWAGGFNSLGGANHLPRSAKVEIRDVQTNTSSFACLSTPKANFSAVKKDGKIIFFTDPSSFKNDFDIYDVGTNTWSVGVLNKSIIEGQAISINNVIYVYGFDEVGGNERLWKLEF
jgi:hypothetical protein